MILSAEFQVHRKMDMFFTTGFIKEKDEFIKKLVAEQEKLEFDMWEFGACTPKIELIKSKRYKKEIMEYAEEFPVIKIEIEIDMSKDIKEMYEYYKMDLRFGLDWVSLGITHTAQIALTLFERNIMDIFIAANIANPGTIYMSNIVFKINEDKIISRYCLNPETLNESVAFCVKRKYPTIRKIEFLQAWNWLRKFKEYKKGFSAGSVERSLNCLSALFQKKESEVLFLAVMGLEALYAQGEVHTASHIKERSQLLLGHMGEQDSLFGDMYKNRSKYIHGEMNIPFSGLVSNFIEEQRVQRHIDATKFAVGLLISSIQHLCMEGRLELEFETKIAEKR